MDIALIHTTSLLGVAILVAMLARRLSLPYTVGLVVTGVGLAVSRLETGAMLTHDFIFDVILPPLLFEAAINIHWRPLCRDMLPVLTLSTLGVILSAACVAAGMVFLLSWPVMPALVFGVLIAATDPIAVIALFKDIGVTGRLRLLVESESLFNDGVAAVLFGLALTWTQLPQGASLGGTMIALTLAKVAGGGIFVGIACGIVAIAIAWGTSDHLIETSLTAVAAYGSFLLAESFHLSGVLATVAAGLLMGNLGVLRKVEERNALSLRGREFVIAFWEFAAFIANSLVFLLIGLRVAGVAFTEVGAAIVPVAILLVLAGRAVTVYPLCLLFVRSRWAIPMREQHILWWGGLRGALALALALALPISLPFNNAILIATFGVVTFSVVVQGLTMPILIRRSCSYVFAK
jgi:CPA1 family monovalent cation:H+ antiporter